MSIATDVLPANTTVWFGNNLPTYTAPLTLQITEITGDQEPAEIGQRYRREETYSLICTLTVYQGGVPDFSAQLTSLMGSFALLSAAIGNNPDLSGTVRYAQVGNFDINCDTDQNGQGVTQLDFAVRCSQRVESLLS